ncbi:hypothetical protein RJ639_005405 [Escallonia herrerae]|uniref:DCD domain-containing protein n=1 Tax=Escallonia herrerae TaxID=1293975 RepID=A0AA89AXP5_9ASTE|nr:hypothetical protein RJ639_005405 [Escallonia herrerae]
MDPEAAHDALHGNKPHSPETIQLDPNPMDEEGSGADPLRRNSKKPRNDLLEIHYEGMIPNLLQDHGEKSQEKRIENPQNGSNQDNFPGTKSYREAVASRSTTSCAGAEAALGDAGEECEPMEEDGGEAVIRHDRKLHGIFEAESAGQLEINPHGWTTDSTMSTPYPAQVQVRIKQQCCPLPEHVFRPIIADNYYEARLFWFELDRAQTNKLISLFSSSPLVAPAPSSQHTTRWNTLFHPVPAPDTRERDNDIENLVSEANNTSSDHTIEWTWDAPALPAQNISEPSVGAEAVAGNQKFIPQRSYSSVVSNVSTSVPEKTSQPEKKWSALFETSSAYDTMRKDECLRMQVTNPISLPPDQSNIGWESSHGAPCLDRENSHALEACEDELTAGKYDEDLDLESFLNSSALKESAEFLPPNTSVANTLTAETRDGGQHLKTVDLPLLDYSNLVVGSSALLDGERQPSESSLGYDANEICDDSREEPPHQKTNSEYSYSSTTTNEMNFEENHESDTSQPFWTADQHAEQRCSSAAKMVTEMKSSDLQTAVIKLMQEIEGLKGSQLKQIMKVDILEKELVLFFILLHNNFSFSTLHSSRF